MKSVTVAVVVKPNSFVPAVKLLADALFAEAVSTA